MMGEYPLSPPNMARQSFGQSRSMFLQSSDDASMTAIEALQQEAQAAMQSRNVACVQDFFTHEVSKDSAKKSFL